MECVETYSSCLLATSATATNAPVAYTGTQSPRGRNCNRAPTAEHHPRVNLFPLPIR